MTEAIADRPKRRQRLVRRVVFATGGLVLLISNYVALWCCYYWDFAPRFFVGSMDNVVNRHLPQELMTPLDLYAESEFPGSDVLNTLQVWSLSGGNASWEMCVAETLCAKHDDCERLDQLLDELATTPSPATDP